MKRLIVWLVAGLALIAAGVLVAPVVNSVIGGAVDTRTEDRNSQLVTAITRTEEVALVSLGIQGIIERTERTTLFGWDLPGSGRALFLQYTFHAKLGLDGASVGIEPTGENAYTISVPEFGFIGYDDLEFRLISETAGILSFTNPRIDQVEMANSVLDEESQRQYVEANADLLREQAEDFYSGIILGIDPELDLRFVFEEQPRSGARSEPDA